ncbi:MAG: aminoglycoside 6-adenylyltransferase [Paludibacter sp.]|uniref:aminoglycoside 6-adenylyltransferase n=1 Tax=Dysgonomonas sp. HDW5A TaxID=2714926 RepID=UPI001B592BE8|nr:aminoglycoside 6-adenylyltransferase [Dysgonomonas sp. HDW5A]MBP6663167.1 aminoglycoside 6-adenylyltransferase [Paludibacter sp.]MBP7613502.1 aminoglycoside 6-adenylyltransferase [Paludibacter sp.]MBP9481782.1 aminoglycoside 6-adenylyltransferase [Parabacteroides sp.]MBP9579679.1 aminoglycoside 6-adenylyltransferase [Parabacteroides sp.]
MTQLQMINQTKFIAQQDENVSAIFMYGSFTKNEGDKYSDIEFYIFLKSKENFSAEKWVNQIYPVALYFTNEYGSEVAIFENMIRGEFHFLKTDEIGIIKSWEGIVSFSDFDQMNLIDKDGLLSKTLNLIKIKLPDRITNENILWLSQSLLNVLLTTSNLIKRGEFAHAHQSLSNIHKYLLWLIRLANQQTQHWESPTKNLEKDIEKIWYSEYKTTTSDSTPENLNIAVQNSLKLSNTLFDKLNVESKLKQILKRIE